MRKYRQATLENLKKIVNEQQVIYFRWDNKKDSIFVDTLTAKIMLEVYESFDEELKQKFENAIVESRGKFIKIARLCWSYTYN